MGRLKRVTTIHLDLLKEIGNIGAGHAATAMSSMIGRTVDMKVPRVQIIPFDAVTELVGGSDTVVAAVFFRIEGDAPGSIYFMLPLAQAARLIKQLTGKPLDTLQPPYDEFGMDALQEIGNILAGSYISSLADFTKLHMHVSVPAIGIDMAGALLDYGLIELSREGTDAIVIDTSFFESAEKNTAIKAQVLLLPDPVSFDMIFQSLGVPLHEE